MFVGVVIGFDSVIVNVAEDGGNAVLTVLLTGRLQRNVSVTFTTIPDSATGKAFVFEH